jgi:hypothetical protein
MIEKIHTIGGYGHSEEGFPESVTISPQVVVFVG